MSSHQSSPNSMEEEEEEDWSNLPYDLIEGIMDQVAEYTLDISDYARCAAVCVSWRQVYIDHDPSISPQLPVLMIPTDDTTTSSSSNKDQFYSFYRITDGKVYDRLKFRMPSYRHCRGSSYGWLVTVDDVVDKGFPVKLINPFLTTYNNISLPSLKHLPVYDSDHNNGNGNDDGPSNYTYLHKAILTADPLSRPIIIMTIYGGEWFTRLAYWRNGDQAWVPIGPKRMKFEDVILKSNRVSSDSYSYLNDEFWAVTSCGSFFSFKVRDILKGDTFANFQKRSKYCISRVKLPHVPNKKLYLVPVWNKTWLFLVLRVIDIGDEDETTKRSPYSTKEFKVFLCYPMKMKMKEQDGGNIRFVWKEKKTLFGHTFFIGGNASMSIVAEEDCPPGFKRDCIYYTDDCYAAGNDAHDMGLFNVKDSSFEKHCQTNTNNPIWPIPIWVEPSIQKAGGVFRE